MTRIIAHSVALIFLAALAASAASGRTPLATFYLYLVVSLMTFAWYARDKSAARRGARRTPENRLHLLALLGGWPGALMAQQQLRHKTRKLPFHVLFWATVALNCGTLILLHSPQGVTFLQQLGAGSW